MRVLTRFESADGLLILTLPMRRGEQSEGQSARVALERPPLMAYAADLQGSATVVPDVAEVRLRAVLLDPEADADLDQLRALLRRIGRGKLWMRLGDASERWCWARADELGSYEVSYERPVETGISLTFLRLSDWYAATQSEVSQAVTASPTSLNLTSNGRVPTRQLEVEITANAVNGFANPTVKNVSAAMSFTVSASSTAAGQKVRVTTSGNLTRGAQFWDGSAWSDVPVTPGGNQAELMVIEPGTQVIEVTGVTDGTVTVRWHDAFA